MISTTRAAFVASTLVLTAMTAGDAAAGFERRRENLDRGFVTAESRFGHGSVSGAVRRTDRGPQVRLPGGSWVWCGRSCSETLRTSTVDFWENQGRDHIDNPCGILGCLELRF